MIERADSHEGLMKLPVSVLKEILDQLGIPIPKDKHDMVFRLADPYRQKKFTVTFTADVAIK